MLSQNGETKESIKKLDKVSRLSLEIRLAFISIGSFWYERINNSLDLHLDVCS